MVLFVGSGFERKGLTYLLQAFGSLTDKTSHLWVVGKGHIASYRRAAERLGVADRVKFWGPVTETAPFYQAATVLALPTLYDPCSNVVLEALACGTPAVTTAANGAAEFITPGENGAIFPQPDDIAGLSGGPGGFSGAGAGTPRCAGPRPRRWPDSVGRARWPKPWRCWRRQGRRVRLTHRYRFIFGNWARPSSGLLALAGFCSIPLMMKSWGRR